jgi:hypothetical protein
MPDHRATFTVSLFGPTYRSSDCSLPHEWNRTGESLGRIKKEAEAVVVASEGAYTGARVYAGSTFLDEYSRVCYGETLDTFTLRSGWGQ